MKETQCKIPIHRSLVWEVIMQITRNLLREKSESQMLRNHLKLLCRSSKNLQMKTLRGELLVFCSIIYKALLYQGLIAMNDYSLFSSIFFPTLDFDILLYFIFVNEERQYQGIYLKPNQLDDQ